MMSEPQGAMMYYVQANSALETWHARAIYLRCSVRVPDDARGCHGDEHEVSTRRVHVPCEERRRFCGVLRYNLRLFPRGIDSGTAMSRGEMRGRVIAIVPQSGEYAWRDLHTTPERRRAMHAAVDRTTAHGAMRGGNGARTGHRCFCNTRSTANSPDCPYHEKGKERRSSRNGTIGQAGRPPVHPVRRAHRCTQSPGRRQPNLDPSRTSYHRQDRRSPEMETVRTPASHIRTSCINPRVPASSRRPPTTPRRRTTVITVAHRLPRDLDPGCRPSPEAKRLVKFFCWNDFSSDLGCSSRTSAWRGCCCCEISTTASSGGSSRRHHGPRLFYR